jgi:hypothetical protein
MVMGPRAGIFPMAEIYPLTGGVATPVNRSGPGAMPKSLPLTFIYEPEPWHGATLPGRRKAP